ncbi:TlpA family protein disulfide reductase [Marinilabilia salmonicolor]|uniref:TlpA family protein disulfide reductase n=1 Tax=Marinilabilia salmonicolor TaxID=989 RepID=UPI0002DE1A4D|nr:TlpA disulfide reductase family protein [Marinilabilia salmonicolor]
MKNKLLIIITLTGIVFLSFINGSPEPRVGLDIGNKVPEISEPLLDGTRLTSEDLKGKMVLIDFWASYDAQSRVENPLKTEMLTNYSNQEFLNGKDLVIVSISLDRFKTPLNQVIQRDNLETLNHICNFQGRESNLAKDFEVEEQMKNYLVDGDGRIVAVTNDIRKIDQTLARLRK